MIVGVVAVVAVIGGVVLIPRVSHVFGASNAANVAGGCASASAVAATDAAVIATPPASPSPSASAAAAAATPIAATPAPAAAASTASGSVSTAPAAPSTAGSTAAATPTASAVPCPVSAATTPAARPSATASAGPRVPVSPRSFAGGPLATRPMGDVARFPVDGQGSAISLNQNATQAATSGNCTLVVPPHPLTAAGLAKPWQLGDGCSEANPSQQGFVEATILSRRGRVQVYDPLVITAGSTPAAAPARPAIARGSEVIIDIGSNGTNLVLTGPGAGERSSDCVDALGQSVIGQVSACNAFAFYRLANAEVAAGRLRVPPAGTSLDGQMCLTTRDFALIDQDQSDNTYAHYLLNGNGQTAQNTAANKNAMGGATLVGNGSDNALLGLFVDPANGCTPFTEPNTTDANGNSSSQALNELSAGANQAGKIALTPVNDEMTLVGANFSIAKTNVYRSLVDQPLLRPRVNAALDAAAYCMNMTNIAPARDQMDMARDANFTSPVPTVGTNLATFLGNRLSMSFANLGCQNLRPDRSGDGHHGRERGGHRGDVQHRAAAGHRPGGGHKFWWRRDDGTQASSRPGKGSEPLRNVAAGRRDKPGPRPRARAWRSSGSRAPGLEGRMAGRWRTAGAAGAGTAAALAAAALLSGCGTAGASTTGVSSDTSVEMIAGSQNSSFYLSMECGAAQEARRLGINLTVVAPQSFTAADQIPLVRGVIVGNPDALIISPASPTALDQDLTVAEENDTKIILADTSVADRDVGASRITSDNAAGGKIAADNLGRMLGGKGRVAVLTAPDGGLAAAARITAFQQEMAARFPGIRLLAVQNDKSGDSYDARQLAAEDIKAHPDLAAVLGMTADTAKGAIAALSKVHKQGVVKVATFDASPVQMTWLDTGSIALAVAQEPALEGADAVIQAVSAIADRKVIPHIATPMIAITPQNMARSSIKPYIYDGTCVSSLRGVMTDGD